MAPSVYPYLHNTWRLLALPFKTGQKTVQNSTRLPSSLDVPLDVLPPSDLEAALPFSASPPAPDVETANSTHLVDGTFTIGDADEDEVVEATDGITIQDVAENAIVVDGPEDGAVVQESLGGDAVAEGTVDVRSSNAGFVSLHLLASRRFLVLWVGRVLATIPLGLFVWSLLALYFTFENDKVGVDGSYWDIIWKYYIWAFTLMCSSGIIYFQIQSSPNIKSFYRAVFRFAILIFTKVRTNGNDDDEADGEGNGDGNNTSLV